jgi:hypothetical protein
MIELARRESGSLHVALVWKREIDLFTVSVNDTGTGDHFELVVERGNALDVYYHRTRTQRCAESSTRSPPDLNARRSLSQRDRSEDERSLAWRGDDADGAVQGVDSILHVAQPDAVALGAEVETQPVVPDRKPQAVALVA